MTLRRRDEFQAAVFVLVVVPTNELLRPGTSRVETRERLARVPVRMGTGAMIHLLERGMESKVHGNKRAGDDLLVTVQEPIQIKEELSPPTPVSSVPGTNINRSAFYQSTMEMSSSEAEYTFMVDQLLSERYGMQQEGIPALKEAVLSSEMPVLLNLKDGNIEAARKTLANLPCGR